MTAKPMAVAVVILTNSGQTCQAVLRRAEKRARRRTFPVWLVAAAHQAHRVDHEAVQRLAHDLGGVHVAGGALGARRATMEVVPLKLMQLYCQKFASTVQSFLSLCFYRICHVVLKTEDRIRPDRISMSVSTTVLGI